MQMKPIMKEESVGLEEKSSSTHMKMDMLKDTKMPIRIINGVITEIMDGTMAGMQLITGVTVHGMAITIGLDREAVGVSGITAGMGGTLVTAGVITGGIIRMLGMADGAVKAILIMAGTMVDFMGETDGGMDLITADTIMAGAETEDSAMPIIVEAILMEG